MMQNLEETIRNVKQSPQIAFTFFTSSSLDAEEQTIVVQFFLIEILL